MADDAPATQPGACSPPARDPLHALLPRAARTRALRVQWGVVGALLAALAVVAALYLRG